MIRTERVTQDRVYRALKDDLFANVYPLRQRMDLATLARRYGASKTPLREALFRLVAERLLAQHPEGGYQIAVPSAARLAHLYFWNAQHLLAALHVTEAAALTQALAPFRDADLTGRDPQALIGVVAGFFSAIGTATGNSEFMVQIDAASERLHYPRLAEATIFPDSPREVRALLTLARTEVHRTLRRRILSYHRRRIDNADRIAALWTSKAMLA